MALPLLEGMLTAPDKPGRRIFQLALKEEKCYNVIQRFLRRFIQSQQQQRKRSSNKNSTTTTTAAATTTTTNLQHKPQCEESSSNTANAFVFDARPKKRLKRSSEGDISLQGNEEGMTVSMPIKLTPPLQSFNTLHHWWWRSLTSYVDAERSGAARILIEACDDSKEDKFLLIRPLLLLLEALVQRLTDRHCHQNKGLAFGQGRISMPLSRPLIGEMIALVDHVMTSSSMVLVAQHRWHLLQRVADHVMQLTVSGQNGMLQQRLAVQDCLRGILGLLHKWLLVESRSSSSIEGEAIRNRHLHIWLSVSTSERTTGQSSATDQRKSCSSWSPLAALLTAFAATKASMHWLVASSSSKGASSHVVLSLLQMLVDPERGRQSQHEQQQQTKASFLPWSKLLATTTRHRPTVKTAASTNGAPLLAVSSNSTNRTAAIMAMLEGTTRRIPSAPSSPSANPPTSRLSEEDDEDDEEEDDDETEEVLVVEEDEDDDLIMEEAEMHDQQVPDGNCQEEESKEVPELHPVESEDEEEDLEHDEIDEDDCCIPRGQEGIDHDLPEEDDDDDDDHVDDDLENMHVGYHPLFSSSTSENRIRTRCLFPTSASSDHANPDDIINNSGGSNRDGQGQDNGGNGPRSECPEELIHPPLTERRRAFVQAAMDVMQHQHGHTNAGSLGLSVDAENYLFESVNQIITPPKKPLRTKIIMRRAPTQEEFFRGTLSRNPISIDSLAVSTDEEPTVGDLRQHIANDLQMADSAELIEILVANKIVGVNLRLRLVHQVLWRQHLMENSAASSSTSLLSMGSGFSVIFSNGRASGSGIGITADTPASQLPPMIAMYRK